MAKRALAVTRVVFRQITPVIETRYETVGVMTRDIETILPPEPGSPVEVKSRIRFKRAGRADIMTAHAVNDLTRAINGDVELTLREDG